jgi:predicted nucleic acid-binding Zn ribbon protein
MESIEHGHIHRVESIKDPIYRYRCIDCGKQLKILSGVLMNTSIERSPQRTLEKLAGVEHVRSVTIIGKNAVYYAVEAQDTTAEEWVEVWSKTVGFSGDKAHRPGGAAFQATAMEQEQQLREAVKLVSHEL